MLELAGPRRRWRSILILGSSTVTERQNSCCGDERSPRLPPLPLRVLGVALVVSFPWETPFACAANQAWSADRIVALPIGCASAKGSFRQGPT